MAASVQDCARATAGSSPVHATFIPQQPPSHNILIPLLQDWRIYETGSLKQSTVKFEFELIPTTYYARTLGGYSASAHHRVTFCVSNSVESLFDIRGAEIGLHSRYLSRNWLAPLRRSPAVPLPHYLPRATPPRLRASNNITHHFYLIQ